jgi:hypothetical protein
MTASDMVLALPFTVWKDRLISKNGNYVSAGTGGIFDLFLSKEKARSTIRP